MLLHQKSGKQRPFDKEKSGTVIVISIVLASYILFFTFQVTSEFAMLNEVFSISRDEQLVLTENLARIMSLKFNIVENILTDAATRNSNLGDVSTEGLITLIQQKLVANDLSEGQVIIINSDNLIIDTNTPALVSEFNVGDTVEYPWVMEIQKVHTPIFSSSVTNGNEKEEDDIKLFFAQPLFDQNGRYEGIAALILSSTFLTDEYSYSDVSRGVSDKEVAVVDDQLRYVLTSDKEHRGRITSVS